MFMRYDIYMYVCVRKIVNVVRVLPKSEDVFKQCLAFVYQDFQVFLAHKSLLEYLQHIR